jgi:FkbM family methyltransferase
LHKGEAHLTPRANPTGFYFGEEKAAPFVRTNTKIFIASMAYRAVSTVRRLAGKGNSAIIYRGGIRWQLDLAEGVDFSIYLLGRFERSTSLALGNLIRPGDTVLDIGANIGAHTLPMARHVGSQGRIFAIEPSDFAFAKLKANVALNPSLRDRIHAHQAFLTDELHLPMKETIYASWPLEKRGSVHPKHRGRLTTTAGACIDTLDSFADREQIARLDLIKIDVDGNEYSALSGGLRTLRALRPILLMELSPYLHAEQGNHISSLIDLLRTLDYSIEQVGVGRPLRADELDAIPDGSSINVIAHSNQRVR